MIFSQTHVRTFVICSNNIHTCNNNIHTCNNNIHTYIYIDTCIYKCMYTCIHICIYIYIYAFLCIYIHGIFGVGRVLGVEIFVWCLCFLKQERREFGRNRLARRWQVLRSNQQLRERVQKLREEKAEPPSDLKRKSWVIYQPQYFPSWWLKSFKGKCREPCLPKKGRGAFQTDTACTPTLAELGAIHHAPAFASFKCH